MYDGDEEILLICSLAKLQAVHLKWADMAFYITFNFLFLFYHWINLNISEVYNISVKHDAFAFG